jgi:hypothetical protein
VTEVSPLYAATRRALLDALEALVDQSEALVLVGAQAIFLHTGESDEAIATETKDADLALDPSALVEAPLLEAAMKAAGFHLDLTNPQPGSWLSPTAIPSTSCFRKRCLGVQDGVAAAGYRRTTRCPPDVCTASRAH